MAPDGVNEVIKEQTDQALFDSIAHRYARKDSVLSASLARKSQLLCAIKPILDELASLGTVVDIGCGVGAPARYLAGHYERYIGIDQSEEMIRAATMFNENVPQTEFVAANIKSRELPRDIADTVLSIGALHHMTELDDVMASLTRIAKQKAFFLTVEPQNGNPLVQMMRGLRGIVDPSYSREQTFFSERSLRDLFTSHDIVDLSVDFQGFFTPPLAQVIMHPQVLFVPIARAAAQIDPWLNTHLPRPLKKLSFNMVTIGRFTK